MELNNGLILLNFYMNNKIIVKFIELPDSAENNIIIF